jgi:hypothetical protein
MKKWFFGVALLVSWLNQTGTAAAQHIPTPYGAARIPEPVPCPTPNLIEGPIGPLGAPPGPPLGVDLPADHSSAFQCEEYVRDEHFFAHFGAVALMRQKLGHFTTAIQDPLTSDTGVFPPEGGPAIQTLNELGVNFQYGPRATFGYLWQNHAIELTGFWLSASRKSAEVEMEGRVDLPFVNTPAGFSDNNLFVQIDRVNTEYRTSLGSAELNYRYTDAAVAEAELILGVRFIDHYESIRIFAGDDDDDSDQASYQIQTRNRIVAPQVGFEWGTPFTPWLRLGLNGKAALGVNFAEVRTTLVRDDGTVGFNQARHSTIPLAQVYDMGAFVDVKILERMRLRLGYNAMFLVNVAVAEDNINFNLENPTARVNNHGSIFYHGPMVELQFLF